MYYLIPIGRMLQLILGCAVNCENKQQYIESKSHLDKSELATHGVWVNGNTRKAWMRAIKSARTHIWIMSYTFSARGSAEA